MSPSTTPVIERPRLNDLVMLPLLDDRLPRLRRRDELTADQVFGLFDPEVAASLRLGASARLTLRPKGFTACVVTVALPPSRRIALRAEVVSINLVVGLVEVAGGLGWSVLLRDGIKSVGRNADGTGVISYHPGGVARSRSR